MINTVFKKIIFVKECESTNLLLNNILKERGDESSIVLRTDFQTNGVGQKGNFWESERKKNLLFSYNVNFENLNAVKQFYLSAIVSLAIVNLLKKYLYSDDIYIKWPNDIYVGNKKIAGILIENSLIGNRIKSSVIGVGINVNQIIFTSSAPNPVSLKFLKGEDISIEEIFEKFILEFEKKYLLLKELDFFEIKTNYLEFLYQKDEPKNYLIDKKNINGIIRGIDKYGFLQIEIDNKIKSFDIKEVVYL